MPGEEVNGSRREVNGGDGRPTTRREFLRQCAVASAAAAGAVALAKPWAGAAEDPTERTVAIFGAGLIPRPDRAGYRHDPATERSGP